MTLTHTAFRPKRTEGAAGSVKELGLGACGSQAGSLGLPRSRDAARPPPPGAAAPGSRATLGRFFAPTYHGPCLAQERVGHSQVGTPAHRPHPVHRGRSDHICSTHAWSTGAKGVSRRLQCGGGPWGEGSRASPDSCTGLL